MNTTALTTSANQAELYPEWKQEVNRRLAARKSRIGSSTPAAEAPAESQRGTNDRAAQIAARVAARYAMAPSYNDLLTGEARAAVRAAKAASRAATAAQAAAQQVLAGLEELRSAEQPGAVEKPWDWTTGHAAAHDDPVRLRQDFGIPQAINLGTEHPAEAGDFGSRSLAQGAGVLEHPAEKIAATASQERSALRGEATELREPAKTGHANLIEFPRELVATRKLRPRLAEGPVAARVEPEAQLSIFEVEPGSVAAAEEAAVAAVPAWQPPVWQGIELEAAAIQEAAAESAPEPAAPAIRVASMGRRLLATVVDCALMAGAFLGAAAAAMHELKELPGLREMELGGIAALIGIGVLYHVVFLALGEATPGMKYAQLTLRTLRDRKPSRARRCGRLGALALSLAPAGLGSAWALFDENRLGWHDRLSGTYLARG